MLEDAGTGNVVGAPTSPAMPMILCCNNTSNVGPKQVGLRLVEGGVVFAGHGGLLEQRPSHHLHHALLVFQVEHNLLLGDFVHTCGSTTPVLSVFCACKIVIICMC